MATKYKLNKKGYYQTNVWDGSYDKDGKKHLKTLRSRKSSKDLEKKVEALRQEVLERQATRLCPHNFYDYALYWLKVSKSTKEKNTTAMYQGVIERYFTALKDIPLPEIRHSHIQQIINENADHPRTCQQIALTFKQVVKMAVRDCYLSQRAFENLTTDISLPKYQKPKKRALNGTEKEALKRSSFCSSSDRKQAFVSLLYYTGIRRGEALALTPFDFDWKKKTVSITKSIIFDKNKGIPELKDYPKSQNGIRTIPLPDDSIPKIKPFVTACEGGFLFHGQFNDMMTLSGYNVFWKSILTELNRAMGYNYQKKVHSDPKPIEGLTAHVFRHNYCTELCYQIPKISTKKIAQLLGDTEKMVLDVYSHINEEKEEIEESLNAAFKY